MEFNFLADAVGKLRQNLKEKIALREYIRSATPLSNSILYKSKLLSTRSKRYMSSRSNREQPLSCNRLETKGVSIKFDSNRIIPSTKTYKLDAAELIVIAINKVVKHCFFCIKYAENLYEKDRKFFNFSRKKEGGVVRAYEVSLNNCCCRLKKNREKNINYFKFFEVVKGLVRKKRECWFLVIKSVICENENKNLIECCDENKQLYFNNSHNKVLQNVAENNIHKNSSRIAFNGTVLIPGKIFRSGKNNFFGGKIFTKNPKKENTRKLDENKWVDLEDAINKNK